MSADAVGHVYRHATVANTSLLVLLAIADTVSDQYDNECWMSFTTLATKARCDRDTVRRVVGSLVEAGWLELVEQSRGGVPSRYRFVFDDERPVVWEGRRRTPAGSAGRSGSDPRQIRATPAGDPRDTPARSAGNYKNRKEPNAPHLFGSGTLGGSRARGDVSDAVLAAEAALDARDAGSGVPDPSGNVQSHG